MRVLLILYIILWSSFIYSQDSITSTTHGIRFSLGITATPIWNIIKNNKDDFNQSIGTIASINFDNWLELKTGILMDLKKYSVYEYDFYEYINKGTNADVKKIISFKYLRIPATFNFYLMRKSPFFLFSSFGLVLGIPFYNDSGIVEIKSIDYSGQSNNIFHLGIGSKWAFSENTNLVVEPFFNRFFNPIIQEHIIIVSTPFPYPNGPGHTYKKRYIDVVNSRNYLGINFILNYYF